MRFSTDAAALRRAVDVIGDALIVLAALVGAALALGQSFAGVGWVLVSLAGLTGQLVWTWSQQQQGPWSPMGRAVVLRSAAAVSTAVCLTIADGSLAHDHKGQRRLRLVPVPGHPRLNPSLTTEFAVTGKSRRVARQ